MKKIVLSMMVFGLVGFMSAQETTENQSQNTEKTWNQNRGNRQGSQMQRGQNMMDRYKDLNLTPEQQEKIKALREKNMQEMRSQMQGNREAMKSRREEWQKKNDADMKAILTPEQYEKWQSQRQKQMKRFQNGNQQNWNRGGKMRGRNNPQTQQG